MNDNHSIETNNNKVTLLLQQIKSADGKAAKSAADKLVELVYQDLKIIASRQRQKIFSNTINTTGLVNEAWLKLQNNNLNFNDRNHFMAVATLAIRHLLINEANKKQQLKRKHTSNISYSSQLHGDSINTDWLLDLDKALDSLKKYKPRLSQVFQMKFFSGFTESEIADFLQVNERTVRRDWIKAKLMLSMSMN